MEALRQIEVKVRKQLKKKLAKGFLIEKELNNPFLEEMRKTTCMGGKGKKPCDLYDAVRDECTKCGCIIEYKVATLVNRNITKGTWTELADGGRLEQTHCPLGKWMDKEIANFYRLKDGLPILK